VPGSDHTNSIDRGSPWATAGWLLLLAVVYGALGWLCLGFEQPASHQPVLRRQTLPAGQEIRLARPQDANTFRWQLVVQVGAAAAGQSLVLNGAAATKIEDGRLYFAPITPRQPRLRNRGDQPVTITEAWWKNSAAHNTGLPRFAVVWSPRPQRRVDWVLLVFIAIAVLLLQYAGLRQRRHHPAMRRGWPLLLAPGLILGLALGLYAAGLRLVLVWDAVLLLAALAPAVLGAPAAARSLAAAWAAPAPWWKRALPAWAALTLLVVVAVGMVMAVPSLPAKAPFDTALVKRLQAERPDYIIMGNSMAGTRIDTELLGQLTHAKVFDLHRNQTYSTIWYLLFKNIVIGSGIKPRAVFMFFRNDKITHPWRGTAGRLYMVWAEPYSRDQEPLVEHLVLGRDSLQTLVYQTLAPLYRMQKYGPELRAVMSGWAMALARLAAQATGYAMDRRRRMWERTVNLRFHLGHLRSYTLSFRAQQQKRDLDFPRALARSYLPEMIRLAKQHGIRLVLVRIQSRPLPNGKLLRFPPLVRYVQDLRRYLKRQGIEFYDFTGDPEVTLKMYSNRDHIAPAYKAFYTRLFYRRLKRVFQSPGPERSQ